MLGCGHNAFLASTRKFDFISSITIGGLISGPLFLPNVALEGALINIALLGLLNVVLAYLSLKYSKFRRIVQDEPIIVIQNGKILENMMRQTRFNLDGNVLQDNLKRDHLTEAWLLQELQAQGIDDPNEVFAAILDTKGTLFVSKKKGT